MLKRIAILLSSITLVACGSDTSENTDKLNVLSHLSPCYGVGQRLCLMTKDGNDNVNFFYSQIEGFDFTWGSQYELIISISNIKNPPADSSSKQYKLNRIKSQTEDSVGTKYDYKLIELLDNTFIKQADTYYFLGTPFVCGSEVDCELLVSLNNSGGLVNATFEYLGEGEIQLTQWN
ncbi:hypothetical protein CWB73_20635 [Pseudoalteromonas phenolica]|uniref:DUF4377 domain-containing protein n=1 Tax=Pseudoalteromonas phenolica TaxID=161398 RepID=A0A5S3YNS2_9GAMM|nr:DUF4377 domain-containing protein [Pseudoalteromonas phenolica]TMP77173.1 hypothetical protein CWB73_20635 [Pseudoalteromonas phenolica]